MRILFIGNSHTYFNNMPHLCAELLRAAAKRCMGIFSANRRALTYSSGITTG